jgi:hypothetical protein
MASKPNHTLSAFVLIGLIVGGIVLIQIYLNPTSKRHRMQ